MRGHRRHSTQGDRQVQLQEYKPGILPFVFLAADRWASQVRIFEKNLRNIQEHFTLTHLVVVEILKLFESHALGLHAPSIGESLAMSSEHTAENSLLGPCCENGPKV